MAVEGQKLRVGLIGSGKMGRHHLKAIAASQMAHVVGIADPAASPGDDGHAALELLHVSSPS